MTASPESLGWPSIGDLNPLPKPGISTELKIRDPSMGEALAEVFGELEPPPDTRDEGFVLWALTRLAEFERIEKQLKHTHKLLRDRVDHMDEIRLAKLEDSRNKLKDFAYPAIKQAAAAMLTGKKKSVDFMIGSVGWRLRPDSVAWPETDDGLLAWCRENLPAAVVVNESVDKTALKKHILTTGELPPGCSVVVGVDEFYARPTAEALPAVDVLRLLE